MRSKRTKFSSFWSCTLLAGAVFFVATLFFTIYKSEQQSIISPNYSWSSGKASAAAFLKIKARLPWETKSGTNITNDTQSPSTTRSTFAFAMKLEAAALPQLKHTVSKTAEMQTLRPVMNYSSQNATFLCLVMTRQAGVANQAAIIKSWGLDCTDLIFLFGNESAADSLLQDDGPRIYNLMLNVTDDYHNTWMKIRAAFSFINNKWTTPFDWIIRIDDDSYLILDNLKKLLADHQPTTPIQFGCRLLPSWLGGYIQTGPGIVLSRAAFNKLMNIFDNGSLCDTQLHTHGDDVELGKCLKSAGVPYGNSSGSGGRPSFIMANLHELVHTQSVGNSAFFHLYSAYPVGDSYDCCADDLIGLHYLKTNDITRYHEIILANPEKPKNARLLVPQSGVV